ncbi:hypothetical protein Tco_1399119 [Tanacetum coccineum]
MSAVALLLNGVVKEFAAKEKAEKKINLKGEPKLTCNYCKKYEDSWGRVQLHHSVCKEKESVEVKKQKASGPAKTRREKKKKCHSHSSKYLCSFDGYPKQEKW